MNYRHIYHAGNRCDVVKHALFTLVLAHLKSKEKGFMALDTHAGTGFYDLDDPRALKTNEAAEGIKSFLEGDPLPELGDYYAVLRTMNPGGPFHVYPGSPMVAFENLRPQDRLVVCELHPEDAEDLRRQMPRDKRIQIHARDGYEALTAFLPPPEKRGVVLIDPPYEQPDEFDVVARRVKDAHRRFSNGIYMIWYPVKDRPAIWKFHEALAQSGIPKILCAEFVYEEDALADRLSGCGMIVINPPWKLDEEIKALFSFAHRAMKTAFNGDTIKRLAE